MVGIYLFIALVFFYICVEVHGNTGESYDETDLQRHLFQNYNRNVMPRTNRSKPLCVSIEMYLLSIDEIDEKRQTISIRAFLELKWNDAFLSWDRAKYSNISTISVKVAEIWTPDIALKLSFGKLGELGHEDGNAVVDHTGAVVVWPYSSYTVPCKISIAKFPFDEQTCRYLFMPWTNTASALKLRNISGKVTLSRYTESGEWELLYGETSFVSIPYGDDFYDEVSFELSLRRKPLFYVMNVMIPVLCISLLNMFCFLLPSEDGERVTLSISIFLTLAVFLTIVNSTMPESSDEASKFGVYVGLQLFGNALTIAVTTISLYVFHRDEKKKIPKILLILVKITCITLPQERNVLFRLAQNVTSFYGKRESPTKLHEVQITGNHANEDGNPCSQKMSTENNHVPLKSANHTSMDSYSQTEEPPSEVTWKMVSVAMDRFWLVGALSWHLVLLVTLIGAIAS